MANIQSADSEPNLPLITVVTAVYNGEKYLEQSVESVINQSYDNVQYIVIDGGSTDRTVDIISRKYSDRIDYWISAPDKGIYDAWNKALLHAKGEWICFIGADDFLLNCEVFEKAAPGLNEFQKSGKTYVYGKVTYLSGDKADVIEVIGDKWSQVRKQFASKMTLIHCGSFHHRSLFELHGKFDSSFKITGDYEFLLREYCREQDFAGFIDLPVVAMRSGGISGSLKTRLLMAREMARARKVNGLKTTSWPITLWIVRIRFYIVLKKIFGNKFTNYLADIYRILKGKRRRWSVT